MILPTTASAVWIVAIVSLLCLGSWANTFKLAGKWRFEYYYCDFVIGILLCAGVAALALGSGRTQELTFQDNLLLVGKRQMAWAVGSGVVLNLGMLLLLAAVTIAGMSVAFPLSLGVALVIGAFWDFANATQANTPLTFMGVALLLAGVILSALAYVRLLRVRRDAAQQALTPDPRVKSKRAKPAGATLAIILSVVGGIALSTFPMILDQATFGDNSLSPYGTVLLLSIGALLSSPFFVLFFSTFPVASTAGTPPGYLSGSGKQHLLGLAGGTLWGTGMLTSLMAAIAPKEAQPTALIQYLLSNGAVVLAAAWGLLAWRELRDGGDRVNMLATAMMVSLLAGLGLVAYAIFPK